ncbi:biliverdin-producing heme oxygenase [Sphingomonas rubra]|uniref:Heme oxygenase n=1 Tax=Sphingomonas rubra TaxID=634430 RepID=A0A1I5SQW4_9SPHN|nr:biliverdin-producing heme oxygenase [Sphingomonas rubra]SFP73133.1 Heme oxygenase [Sphingomonas rubra]
MTVPAFAISRLRSHTAPAHDAVDAAFGAHDLSAPDSYRAFLLAHALALPAAEAVFAAHADLPPWRERTTLLAADLADLGRAMPAPLAFDLPALPGAAWGALYVTEGSRLGGIMLARGVPATLPSRYLGARHRSGEWRTLLAAIDTAGESGGDAWVAGAIAGADACFALYGRAA